MEDKAEEGRLALPEGWSWIEDLQGKLELGKLGAKLAEHAGYSGSVFDAVWRVADDAVDLQKEDLTAWIAEADAERWYKEAQSEGLLEREEEDGFYRVIQAMQHVCYQDDLYGHLEDALQHAAYEYLKELYGAAAVSDGLAERIGKIDEENAVTGGPFKDLHALTEKAVAELAEDGEPGVMTKEEAARAAAGPDSGRGHGEPGRDGGREDMAENRNGGDPDPTEQRISEIEGLIEDFYDFGDYAATPSLRQELSLLKAARREDARHAEALLAGGGGDGAPFCEEERHASATRALAAGFEIMPKLHMIGCPYEDEAYFDKALNEIYALPALGPRFPVIREDRDTLRIWVVGPEDLEALAGINARIGARMAGGAEALRDAAAAQAAQKAEEGPAGARGPGASGEREGAAPGLPGWRVVERDDGTGHFIDPEGRASFQFDKATGEYLDENGEWSDFYGPSRESGAGLLVGEIAAHVAGLARGAGSLASEARDAREASAELAGARAGETGRAER